MKKDILKLFYKGAIALMVPILLALLVWCVDPLQFYRASDNYFPRFYWQERFQNPALARTVTYDTVIVGTSMSENIGIELLKDKYGKNAIRQTCAGSSVYEQQMGLSVALRRGIVREVIWELNFGSFAGAVDKPKDSKAVFPKYLYDTNPFNDIYYLLDPVQMQRAAEVIINPLPFSGLVADYEREMLNKWAGWFSYGEEAVERDLLERELRGEMRENVDFIAKHDLEKLKANFEVNVRPLIEGFSAGVRWVFYLPPFSALEHEIYRKQGIFESEMAFREYVYGELKGMDNVEVFDFQAEGSIINDLTKYKDKMHYDLGVTNWTVEQMMRGKATDWAEFARNQDLIRGLKFEAGN